MPKICQQEECNYPVFGKGFCQRHQYLRTDKKPKKIKPFSDKHRERLKEYSVIARKFKEENPLCMAKLKGCMRETSDVHHTLGRGKNLCNTETFMAVCRSCHNKLHFDSETIKNNKQ